MRRSACLLRAAAFGLALLTVPAAARGQGALGASGFSSVRTTHSVAPHEHVDPFSGNLLLTFTDLELPGNAGFHLQVQRVYNSKIHLDYDDTPNHFRQRTWIGLGWSLHFGRVRHATSNASGQTVIEMPDGSGHPLVNPLAGDPDNTYGQAVTSELWRYDRISHTLRLPNGVIYVFGHIGIGGGPDGQVRYVTEIRDPFNNRLTFEYFGGATPGPSDGVKKVVQHLGGGQTREVTFTVTPLVHGYALATMQYAGRTWTYTQVEPADAPTQVRLMSTAGPVAGTTWSFTYRTVSPGPELLTATGPFGGTLTYTYDDVLRRVWDETLSTRGVLTRVTGGTGISSGTWSFAYNQGVHQNTTVVTGPSRRETYRYNGIGLHQDTGMGEFSAWLVGSLNRTTIETLSPVTILEERLYGWTPSSKISEDDVAGFPSGLWADYDVKKALLTKSNVIRGPQNWETVLTYDTSNAYRYNDYFRPWHVQSKNWVWPSRTRTSTQTFWYGATAGVYLRDRTASTSLTVGSETLSTSYTYDPATGFPTQQTVRGVSTAYSKTPDGNVATVTDAAGKVTTYTYSGGVPLTVNLPDAGATTGIDITRTVNADGTVATERLGPTSGGLTTAFAYDALMRVTQVTPPGGGAVTTTSYPTGPNTYAQTTRGTTYARTYVDGYGRQTRTEDAHGVQVRTEYDALGRVTRQYAPYTTGTGLRYVSHEYDALDRPTKDIAADGTSQTRYTYNGSETWVTDPEGRTTVYHVFSDTGPDGGLLERVRDPATHETLYTYDAAGSLKSTSGPVSGTRTWTYNAQGRLATETHPEAGTTTYTWNPVGTLATLETANNETLTFTYDAAHRLTSRNAPGTAHDLTLAYDAVGRLVTRTVGSVVTRTTFDSAGRPATRKDELDGASFESQYAYDALDRLSSLRYPSLNTATYEYTAGGRLHLVTWQGNPFASFTYHPETGALTSYATGPVTHTVGYDSRDRVQSLGAGSAAAPGSFGLDYTYDRASLVTSISDTRAGQSQSFAYDTLGRLTTAHGPYGTLTWSYAANGNRLTESRPDGSLTYSYHATTHRLQSVAGLATSSFTYGSDGRTVSQVQSAGTTTYGYTPTSLLTSIAAPGVTSANLYDADEWRIRRQVTTSAGTFTTYSLRSLSSETLSQFRVNCAGQREWVSDAIYAGGRLLGSYDADLSLPVVAFMWPTSSPMEQTGSVGIGVTLTTATGASLPCPVTVTWQTPAGGTATPGVDYLPVSNGTLTFPAGFTSGNPLGIEIIIPNDGLDEPTETFAAQLTAVSGGVLGGTQLHTLSILDDDAPPTLHITGTTVDESAGQASVQVTLSAASAYVISATVSAAPGSAVATHDYTPTGVSVIFDPGTVSRSVVVPLTNDGYAEPVESFTVGLSAPVNATLGAASAAVTVTDDDGSRVTIDQTLPSEYFALVHTHALDNTYLQIYNPHAVGVTARITYVRANGTGVVRTHALAPRQRLGLHVNADTEVIAPNLHVSAVVQSTDSTRPLVAEMANYWFPSAWDAGEAVEGVTASAQSWYFAEGATGLSAGFSEWFNIFNPGTEPLAVGMAFYGASGQIFYKTVYVQAGPGFTQVPIHNDLPSSEHSTHVFAYGRDSGQPRNIVVERLMRWSIAHEGHRSTGTSTSWPVWEFAEGGNGPFATFVAIFNPNSATATARVHYRHENGSIYAQDVAIAPLGRVVVGTPNWVPTGGFGIQVHSLSGHALAAERSIYEASAFTFGHSSQGTQHGSTHWRFAEGTGAGMFETYFLLTNIYSPHATVTLTYRTSAGAVIGRHTIGIPGGLRGTVWANGTAGAQDFTTEVTSNTPIVAERAMYWPTGNGLQAAGDSAAAVPAEPLASPFTLTEGTPGPTVVVTETPPPPVGKPVPGSALAPADGTLPAQSLGGLPWYGSHLAVGKKP